MEQREITYKKGDKVYYRWAHNVGHPGLEVHTILEIVRLGDGTVIVRHDTSGLLSRLLPTIEDTPLEEFIQNASLFTNNPE